MRKLVWAAVAAMSIAGCSEDHAPGRPRGGGGGGNPDAGSIGDAQALTDAGPCTPTSTTDEPDPDGIDANCDGVDGELAKAVFVAPGGSDDSLGEISRPVRTVTRALELAEVKRATQVLLAEGEYPQRRAIALKDGIGLHGGYRASDWSRTGGETEIAGKTLVFSARGLTRRTVLSRLTATSSTATIAGAASVVLVARDSTNLVLADGMVLRAGKGANGVEGMTGAAGRDGVDGTDGASGARDDQFSPGRGGSGGVNMACTRANAGNGGEGGRDSRFSGDNGGTSAGGASGGTGGTADGCTARNGSRGSTGTSGAAGAHGMAGVVAGSFQATDGALVVYRAADGGDGADGAHGVGGGGGGGSSGQSGVSCVDGAGNGGGGGGSGGCGGTGGEGGGGGGASVAIVSIDSQVTLDDVEIVTAGGGAGAAGKVGGGAGRAGHGGDGNGYASDELGIGGDGGDGGNGGIGGNGGGGGGGPSVGVWVTGTQPTLVRTTFTLGAGGPGGASPTNAGAAGVRAEVHRP